MITLNNRFVQLMSTAILLVMVFGFLSLIWPVIIALFLGVLLLLRACSAEQETAVLSWTEVGHVSIIFPS